MASRQPYLAGNARREFMWRCDVAPHHHLGEPGAACSCRRHATGHAAVAQNDDLIAELQHLRKLVTDEDNALPLRQQTTENLQKIGHLAWREVGCRLVKDQEISFAQYGFENLDALLAAERQISDTCKGIEVKTKPSAHLVDAIRRFRPEPHTA